MTIRELHEKLTEPKLSFQEWWNSNSEKDEYLKLLEDSFRETKIKINISYKEMALKCCQFFLKGGGGEFLKHKLYYIKDKKNFISLFLFYLKRLISQLKMLSLYIWKTRKYFLR